MSDSGFELTPVDIRAQEFRRTVRGYASDDVDDFRERVAEAVEKLLRERTQLEERLNNFKEQLRAFRERERAMNDALLAAQQLRGEVEENARREAELIVREARTQSDEIIAGAREQEAKLQNDIVAAQRQFSAYVSAFRRLLERHMSEVDSLVEHEVDGTPPEEVE